MMRIVSLLASGTDIVCALGAGASLVGRSHECDNPGWVRRLPVCTRAAFDVAGSSRAIDAEVRRRVKCGEPLYYVDADLIRRLAPDVVITQTHCEVCAVTPEDVTRAGGAGLAAHVVALSAGSVAGIHDGIRCVAAALGRPGAGDALIASMHERISAVTAAVRGRPVPTAVLLEWTDPVFLSGNWTPELVEAAGGRPLFGEHARHSASTPWDRVVEADPDVLIVAPCGFDLERTLREVDVLEALPHWFSLSAVRRGRVALADGNTYFNRSGTTIVETVEILADILHGDGLGAGGFGTAWRSYEPSLRDV
jgi:iron complex transport system substrate-binding protein